MSVPSGSTPAEASGGSPAATRFVLDPGVRRWAGGVVGGGAPFGVARLSPVADHVVARLARAGPAGLVPSDGREAAVLAGLVARGLAHPRPAARAADGVVVVVPFRGRPALLERCLSALVGRHTVVVDDGSPDAAGVAAVARTHGVRLVRHRRNRGPAAARNTGLAVTHAPFVAFLDADCRPPADWLERLVGHLDDPRVAAAAPRVRPRARSSLLARVEAGRSELDLGPVPGPVREGGAIGHVPSAALLVRRGALGDGFDEALRVGEDVDLVWRLVAAGHEVRYEPSITVEHEVRERPAAWVSRHHDYGTSAAMLDRRHPGRVPPVRLSAWNLAAGAALLVRRPWAAAGALLTASAVLGARLRRGGVTWRPAPEVVLRGALADVAALGRASRREWWPLGWVSLAAATRSPVARLVAGAGLVPLWCEHRRARPDVGPLRFVLVRLVGDAAYGTGVLAGALRHRRPGVLLPQVRLPYVGGRARGRGPGRSRQDPCRRGRGRGGIDADAPRTTDGR